MIDPVSAAMQALTSGSPVAFGLVFLAGLLTCIGPCIAPRYLALAAIAGGSRRPLMPSLAFIAGLMSAFVTLGFVAGLLGKLWSISSSMYLVLAAGFIGAGCVALVRADPDAGADDCSTHAVGARRQSLGALFLAGACSALVLSPCCTPAVTAIVATSTAIGKPLIGGFLLLCYAAGHSLPLVFCGQVGRVAQLVPLRPIRQATAVVGAVLMLALGIYYGLLA